MLVIRPSKELAIKRRFSDEQIIGIIKEYEAGVKAQELCRKYGISDATFYKYKVPLDKEPPAKVLADLSGLLSAYLDPHKGYTSRRALYEDREARDFDQLARFGEWDVTDDPLPEDVA